MNSQQNKNQVALNGIELPLAIVEPGSGQNNGSTIPDWVELIPAGMVQGRDGRAWNNSNPQAVIAHFLASGRDLPVDVEHSSEKKAPLGEPAPAAGWIKELVDRIGAIWGRVEWNAMGRELVGSKQYRYISPVILYHEVTRDIAGLTTAGLTNRPNLHLQALNQQQGESSPIQGITPREEENMNFAALLAALGLSATATEAEALTAIQKMKADVATAANSMLAATDLAKFVPRGDYDAALVRATNAETVLADQQKTALETAINSELDLALKAGKITPATRAYHEAQCQQQGGLERFKAYAAAVPAMGGDSDLDGKDPDKTGKALNAEEAQIAGMFGNSVEDITKYAGR